MLFLFKTILYKLYCLEIYVVKVMRVGFYKKLKRFSFLKKITVLIILNDISIIKIGGEANGDF